MTLVVLTNGAVDPLLQFDQSLGSGCLCRQSFRLVVLLVHSRSWTHVADAPVDQLGTSLVEAATHFSAPPLRSRISFSLLMVDPVPTG